MKIYEKIDMHLFTGFRLGGRNDKSLCDNLKLASPEGEGFPPSPKRTLKGLE